MRRGIDPDDIEAVRSALRQVRDSDELLGIDAIGGEEEQSEELRRSTRSVRRALVDELVEFLEAREDLIDLQLESGLNPFDLLGPDPW